VHAQALDKIMKPGRRTFLRLPAGAVALAVAPRMAWALDYPTRPVRLAVEFFPGSLGDIIARVMAQWLSNRLGQQVVVEDQPGAGGNLATGMVVQAAPDGYKLLEVTSANAWNATLYQNLSFDFTRDSIRLLVLHKRRRSWWSTPHSQSGPFSNSSTAPTPIQARSTSLQPVLAHCRMSLPSFSNP
jgi:hypothetical protein